jgi:hypothetical protein
MRCSALRRERVPLASPLASSSRERSLASLLTTLLLSPKGGTVCPEVLYDEYKYEGLQGLAQLRRTP